MRNIITILVLIFIHSISLNVFWHGNSSKEISYNKWEVIVQYKNTDFLDGKLNSRPLSCNYQSYLQENWLTIKEVLKWWIVLISFEDNRTIEEVIWILTSDNNIEVAEPNYLYALASNWVGTNDFFWKEQRWLNYISWPEMYSKYESSLKQWSQTVVWVIDAGINYNHVDLKNSMWNPSTCNLNGSQVYCEHWYDFYSNTSTPLPVWDNHWTHIAGIIAATANNSIGMAGVNPYAKIASLKVTNNYSSISSNFDDFSILKAIDFAIANWIKIINASYGWQAYSETMKAKIKEFGDNWGIFITTAMNDWIDIDRNWGWSIYPCWYDLDNIICVTAINSYGSRPSFANYWSKSVDIAAPWEWILGTISNPRDMYTYFEDFSSCNSNWYRWTCWNETYQFNEWIISPSYYIWWWSNYLLRFDASCNWWSSLRVTINSDWWYVNSTTLSNVWYNQNEYKIVIPSGLSSFSFMVEKDDGNSCSIDNVGVYPAQYYSKESDAYELWKWTSMATPFVSWLASLIRTLNPSLTPSQVKRLILDNGDTNSNLQWITVSWKTINIKKALDAVNITSRGNSYSNTNYSNSYTNNYSYSDTSAVGNFMASMFGESYNNNNSNNWWFEYTYEMQEAFNFAKDNWLTSADSIYSADMDWYLTRIWMAKILSQFAINVLWLQPDYNKYTTYYDVSDSLNSQFDNWATLAYQLWIMWIDTKNFRPYDRVTRAEFATAVSRMVYNTTDWGYGRAYYEPHLYKLKDEWILTNIDPYRIERRWLAFIILMRIAQQNNFVH